MSDDTETTDQTDAADAPEATSADTPVPNIGPNARTGTEHQPLVRKPSTLVGSRTVTVTEDDGTETTTEVLSDTVTVTPDADPGDEGATEVPGEVVESDTAGTGDAVNEQTGEVTSPGDPLPDAPGQESGDPIPAADAVENAEPTQPDSSIEDGAISQDAVDTSQSIQDPGAGVIEQGSGEGQASGADPSSTPPASQE